ncbi:MAG: VWA domain-containing protein, partial [Pseudomonadota bacterium]
MFTEFFLTLRQSKVPVSLTEYLTLMEGMAANVAAYDVEDFYFFSRSALIKDERHLDRFDQVFSHCFKGLETVSGTPENAENAPRELPTEWL